jgi:hypothetical protein
MDLALIALPAVPSVGAGVLIGSSLRSATVAKLREVIAAKDAAIGEYPVLAAKQRAALAEAAQEANGLRARNVDLGRKVGRLEAEIRALEPHAEAGRKAQAQRIAASRAAHAKREAAQSAKPATVAPKRRAKAK